MVEVQGLFIYGIGLFLRAECLSVMVFRGVSSDFWVDLNLVQFRRRKSERREILGTKISFFDRILSIKSGASLLV